LTCEMGAWTIFAGLVCCEGTTGSSAAVKG
jgi:hypothetical protein